VTCQADIDPQRASICHCRLALQGNGDLFAGRHPDDVAGPDLARRGLQG